MENQKDLMKFFLIALIASLIVSALTSILIFLFGSFNEVEIRILMTMASISFASLFGILFSRSDTDYVRSIGITIVTPLFVITIGTIWKILPDDSFYKSFLTAIILSIILVQAPWLLKEQKDKTLRLIAVATFVSASIVALMIIQLILDYVDFNEFYNRLMGVFAVLYLLGLVLGPIFKKLISHNTISK